MSPAEPALDVTGPNPTSVPSTATNPNAATGTSTGGEPPSPRDSNTSGSGSLVDVIDSHLDTHLDKVPKAEVNPDHVASLPTTVEAPAVGDGDSDRPEDPELDDLGWSKDPNVPVPVLHGMNNDELWMLVRRFNQSIYHVRAIPPPPGKLDLNISPDEAFFPDKLRSTLERVYLSVFLSLMGAVKHIVRLRTWNERNRTAGFCVAYFIAWFFNLLMPLFLATTIALIVHPPTRRTLFPPAPLALHSVTSGEEQTPQAGYLASGDSMTGAAEAYKGQAAEQEAANFVTGITSITLGAATGQGAPSVSESAASTPDGEGGISALNEESVTAPSGDVGAALPGATDLVGGVKGAQGTAVGDGKTKDKTKQPMEKAIWDSAGPAMHGLNVVADIAERFANALSPTPPFAQNTARVRLAGVLVPVLLISFFVNESMVYKGASFGVGLGMFGQPLFDRMNTARVTRWLDAHYANWRDMLDIRNTLLYGIPTNAQLTITLLRIGEANKAPLPPPPPAGSISHPKTPTPSVTHPKTELGEMNEKAILDEKHAEQDHKAAKKGSKFIGFIKGTTKATVRSALGADRVKAVVGSEHSKLRLGVVGEKEEKETDGPTQFAGRRKGKAGSIVVTASALSPSISFVRDLDSDRKDTKPVFTMAVDEIAEIRKIGGFGWKGKMLVGWALGTEVADGLEILDKQGNLERLTAIPRRDEVFNRVIALSHKQHWESL